jgi:hypothetical protein
MARMCTVTKDNRFFAPIFKDKVLVGVKRKRLGKYLKNNYSKELIDKVFENLVLLPDKSGYTMGSALNMTSWAMKHENLSLPSALEKLKSMFTCVSDAEFRKALESVDYWNKEL